MVRYLNVLKSIFATLALLTALGCAAAAPLEEKGGVQDLNPGEQTMISAPTNPTESQPRVEERNI